MSQEELSQLQSLFEPISEWMGRRRLPRNSAEAKQFREELRQTLVQASAEDLPTGKALQAVDELLGRELSGKDILDAFDIPRVAEDPYIALWRGDITTLKIDAIVNAANEGGLGCFAPSHRCIDNVIHCAAGPRLRAACKRELQTPPFAGKLPTGQAMVTDAFMLPSDYVIHTPGPVGEKPDLLRQCYWNVLDACKAKRIRSVAFCCISTGLFGYPADRAAQVAIQTVREWIQKAERHATAASETLVDKGVEPPPKPLPPLDLVVFNVFLESDLRIYRQLLGPDAEAVAGKKS